MQKSKSSVEADQVVRDKSGKVDLFSTILARKDKTAPLPVLEPTIVTRPQTQRQSEQGKNKMALAKGADDTPEKPPAAKRTPQTQTRAKQENPVVVQGADSALDTPAVAKRTRKRTRKGRSPKSPTGQAGLPSPPELNNVSSSSTDIPEGQHKRPVEALASARRTSPTLSTSATTTVSSTASPDDGDIQALPPSPGAGGRWSTSSRVGNADDLEAYCVEHQCRPGQKGRPFMGKPTEALHAYCQYPDDIEPECMYYYDDRTVVINDAFAKSMYHYLVLPRKRLPFLVNLKGEEGIQVVKELAGRALWLMNRIKAENPSYELKCGFHVLQSMSQIHLHVLSTDYSTPRMKKKEHWNSFTTDFFISPEYVLRILRERGAFRLTAHEMGRFRAILKSSLRCPICKVEMRTMPEVKAHYLQTHWQPRHLEPQQQHRTEPKPE